MMITLFTTICNTLDDELDLHSLSSSSEREVKLMITSSVTWMGDCAGCSGGGARRVCSAMRTISQKNARARTTT